MSHTQPTATETEPPWSNKQLSLQAECIVVGKYGVVAVYDILRGVRDAVAKEVKRRAATELETAQDKLAQQAARIDELERELAGTRFAYDVRGKTIDAMEESIEEMHFEIEDLKAKGSKANE